MNRTLIGILWLYAGWTAGAAGATLLGASALFGPLAGVAALTILAVSLKVRDVSRRRDKAT